jgi:hypothetical protein
MRSVSRGFMLIDLVVSMAMTIAVIGAVFQLLNPAHGLFEIGLEQADMQQRGRASIETMVRDLHLAGAGAVLPAIAPYRRGLMNPDSAGAAFVDRVSVAYALPAESPVTVTYWTRIDRDDVPQLMKYDGAATDVPVSDFVCRLRFAFFDGNAQEIGLGRFSDGPWIPDAVSPTRFDEDLRTIRRIRVDLGVRPARVLLRMRVREQTFAIDVTPRNLGVP